MVDAELDLERRAIGMVVGAAVGDALGAPFEFQARGQYRRTFPDPVLDGLGEMVGGGSFGWQPGEFTDDTQMALALAESVLEAGSFVPETAWKWFTNWAASAPDVGTTTGRSLRHAHWSDVRTDVQASPANGALMRSFPMAVVYADHSRGDTCQAVLRQSALTHPNPVSGWGAWIAVEMCRRFIHGDDAFDHLSGYVGEIPDAYRVRFAELLAPDWTPDIPHESNGSVWGCLAQAVWAVRSTTTYEDAVVAAVNLGDDADTVGCVAGALAGARYGLEAIPMRWRRVVHGKFDGPHGTLEYSTRDLERVTLALLALRHT